MSSHDIICCRQSFQRLSDASQCLMLMAGRDYYLPKTYYFPTVFLQRSLKQSRAMCLRGCPWCCRTSRKAKRLTLPHLD